MEVSLDKHKILVVEDEQDIRELIHFNLFKENYDVVLAADGEVGLELAQTDTPDLILLDLMLPKKDGLEVCKILKNGPHTKNIPIIILTAKGGEGDIVNGLEAGADDYVTKPFRPKVLMARIKARLRGTDRSTKEGEGLKLSQIELIPDKRRCYLDGEEITLTYSEFQFLLMLMQSPGRVFTRTQTVEYLRGQNHAVTDRSVDVLVVGLRKKLGQEGKLIETVRGVGYRFKDDI